MAFKKIEKQHSAFAYIILTDIQRNKVVLISTINFKVQTALTDY